LRGEHLHQVPWASFRSPALPLEATPTAAECELGRKCQRQHGYHYSGKRPNAAQKLDFECFGSWPIRMPTKPRRQLQFLRPRSICDWVDRTAISANSVSGATVMVRLVYRTAPSVIPESSSQVTVDTFVQVLVRPFSGASPTSSTAVSEFQILYSCRLRAEISMGLLLTSCLCLPLVT
jgi:hypothetical protein